jgi:hypothetical protein
MLHFVFQFYEYLIPIHYIEECVLKDQSNNPKDNEISATEYGHFDESMDISAQEYEASRRQIVAALLHVIFDQVVMAFPYVGGETELIHILYLFCVCNSSTHIFLQG